MSMHEEPDFEPGHTGAFRQSWSAAKFRDVLAKIIAEHKHVPDEDKDSVYRAAFASQLTAGWEFVGAPKADQRLILAAVDYAFTNAYRSYLLGKLPPGRCPVTQAQAATAQAEIRSQTHTEETRQQAEAESQVEETRQAEAKATRVKYQSNLALQYEAWVEKKALDLMMPNGKKLRHCTREEIGEDADWKLRMRDRLQPGQTPDEAGMTEEEVRDLM